MLKTLYVGNLPWSVTEERLNEVFGAFGQVASARVIVDKETGKSRGFGFVQVDEGDAATVMENLHQSDLDGRKITVNEARSRG